MPQDIEQQQGETPATTLPSAATTSSAATTTPVVTPTSSATTVQAASATDQPMTATVANATASVDGTRLQLKHADELLAQQQYANAESFLQSALANPALSDRDRVRLSCRLGISLAGLGNAGAIDVLRAALASGLLSQNESATAQFALGSNLRSRGTHQGAIEAFRSALQFNGGHDATFEAHTHYELAVTLDSVGHKQDALAEFLTAQASGRLDSKHQALVQYHISEIKSKLGQRQEAIDLLHSAISSGNLPKKSAAKAHVSLGNHYLAMQNFGIAEQSYLIAIASEELSAEQRTVSYHGLGAIYKNARQYDKAVEAFRQALATGLLDARSSTFSHYGMGMSQFYLGQDAAANESLRLAISNHQAALPPDLIATIQRIRSNYDDGRLPQVSQESDPEKKLQKTLDDIYAMGGQRMSTARLEEWQAAIAKYLPPESFSIFSTLLERTYAENNKDRGDRYLLAKDMLPVLDRVLRNPGYLKWIASEIQPDSQRACVNQPMASWSRVAALVEFHDASRNDPSLASALTAARSLRGRAAVETYAAEELARERRNAGDPNRFRGVEVEFRNELERLVNQNRMTMGRSQWLGISSKEVPYAQIITNMVTPRRVQEATRAVEAAENVSHEALVDWLTDGPYSDPWQAHLRSVRPDAYSTLEERYVDLMEAATTHAARAALMQQREMELKTVTRALTSSAVVQSASTLPRRTTGGR